MRRGSRAIVVAVCVFMIGVWLNRSSRNKVAGPPVLVSAPIDARGGQVVVQNPQLFVDATDASSSSERTGDSRNTVVADRFLGEVVDDAKNCNSVCGAPCAVGADHRSHCGHICAKDDDCDAASICHPTTTNLGRCTWDQCRGIGHDADCGEGWTCLPFMRATGAVYLCNKAGAQVAGASCIGIGNSRSSPKGLCGPGLFCSEGVCLPGTCDQNADCPKGSICSDVGGFQRCIAACATDAECPAALKCTTLPLGRKVCANLTSAQCIEQGCSAGSRCSITLPLLSQLRAECVQDCASDKNCLASQSCQQTGFGGDVEKICMDTCVVGEPCSGGRVCVDVGQDRPICKFAIDLSTIE